MLREEGKEGRGCCFPSFLPAKYAWVYSSSLPDAADSEAGTQQDRPSGLLTDWQKGKLAAGLNLGYSRTFESSFVGRRLN